MSIVRETYYRALWDLLQTAPGFAKFERRLGAMEKLVDAELPALYMVVGKQRTQRPSIAAPKRTLVAQVVLYCANPDPHVSADEALNGLIDAVEAVLDPAPGIAPQTLGGLVAHCWIEGDTEIFANPNGTRAAAYVPVLMMIP